MHGFVSPDDPVLSAITPAVRVSDIGSVTTQTYIAKMQKVVYGNQIDLAKPIMVGVAAPQLGIAWRIILVDVTAESRGKIGNLKTYVNPELIWKSSEQSEWYEGCYSTDRVCGIVSRANRIKIRALDESGRSVEEDHSGYVARVFQHEIDHLNGMVFVDHITDDSKLHWVASERMPDYRSNEAWRNWGDACGREKWLKIKGVQA